MKRQEQSFSRRTFLKGFAAAGAVALGGGGCIGPAAPRAAGGGRRWYKGVLHAHSFWSDGHAFPEECVDWYRSRGYNFFGLSDHNRFQDDPDFWRKVVKESKGWPPAPTEGEFAIYRERFASETRTASDGSTEVRLKTYAELAEMFDDPGQFLLVPAVEATTGMGYSDGRYHNLHMNFINLPKQIPLWEKGNPAKGRADVPLAAFLEEHRASTQELADKMGRPCLFVLNHPIWQWYDVGPEVLIDAPKVRFFELCNGGGSFGPAKELPDDGFDTDRLWDVVNAFRSRRGQPLLYGIGTDDTHAYHGEGWNMCIPGNAWSLVRAERLDAASLIEAMNRGDFATCEGLEPEDIAFDAKTGTLTVSAEGNADAPLTIRFIVSKADFREEPVATLTVRPDKEKKETPNAHLRTIRVYDRKIGLTAKTVTGRAGERLVASYTMAADDLYVRARIESPTEQGLATAPLHPKMRCAWTQPYVQGEIGK